MVWRKYGRCGRSVDGTEEIETVWKMGNLYRRSVEGVEEVSMDRTVGSVMDCERQGGGGGARRAAA